MEIVLYISASIALLALAALFIFLIGVVRTAGVLVENASKTVNSLVEEIRMVRIGLQGTLQNMEGITGQIAGTIERVNGQLTQVEGIVSSVKVMTQDVSRILTDGTDVIHAARGVVMSVIDFEQDLQLKVQQPITETMTIFSALGKGIRAFRYKLANGAESNGNGHVRTEIYYKS